MELGRYLCEVRAGQYWRLENLNSFDEFLETTLPGIAAEGVLPDVHSRAPATAGEEGAKEVGWAKGIELAKVGTQGSGRTSIVQPGCTKLVNCRRKILSRRSREN